MDRQKELWLWLTAIAAVSAYKITALLDRFDSVESIYEADEEAYRASGILSEREIQLLCRKSLAPVSRLVQYVADCGATMLFYDDEAFPAALRQCSVPPYVLYAKGQTSTLNHLFSISVVGARVCSAYGISAARRICSDLAKNDVTIVSGMAAGIDTAAHRAAIDAGGKTIAFLGCGIDIAYPKENRALMDEIAENGVVLTEFAPGTRPYGSHFPQRNRLIAAFSAGTLVCEAQEKSGSLITADCALQMGKTVFALPGDIDRKSCMGCNRLIREGAAILVCGADDILQQYGRQLHKQEGTAKDRNREKHRPDQPDAGSDTKEANSNKEIREPISISDARFAGLDDLHKKVIAPLLNAEHVHIDSICRSSGLTSAAVSTALTMLELSGYIRREAGQMFSLII